MAASSSSEGPKSEVTMAKVGSSPTLPAAAPRDEPIYTYHRRVTTGPGANDWAEWGVSTRGRTISLLEQENIDNLISTTVKKRNQWGELAK